MATTTKPTAKPGAAKAAKAAAAPASTVATPAKDEAADLAALSNQGSGDSNASTAGAGEQGALGEGATSGAAANTAGTDAAPGDTGTTAALTDDTLAAAANLAADAARNDDSDDEHEGEPTPVAILSRTLVNQTAYVQRLPRLGVIIGPGESLIVGFRDAGHQEKCERQIEQIRELNGWAEDCGLHWGRDE